MALLSSRGGEDPLRKCVYVPITPDLVILDLLYGH